MVDPKTKLITHQVYHSRYCKVLSTKQLFSQYINDGKAQRNVKGKWKSNKMRNTQNCTESVELAAAILKF
jgi:hypothetical protein